MDGQAHGQADPRQADPRQADPRQADPHQARLDRLSRILPLPLLALSAVMAALSVQSGYQSWHRLGVGLAVAALAAVWTIAVTLRRSRSVGWDAFVFAGHSALSAVLVGINPWFGIFSYIGYSIADRLPRPAARTGFVVTALIVAASQMAGYPSSLDPGPIVGYLLVASLNAGLVITFTQVADRVLAQNQERGRVIDELAEANRRLSDALDENAGLHAQLVAQAREAGVLDERQRLAGEIHDTLAQSLIGIITQLEAAARGADERDRARRIELANGLAREALTAARRSVRALRPEQLERASLPAAVADLAATWSRTSGIAVSTETAGSPMPVPPEVEIALFRVAQEALSNAGRHAHASKVALTLTYLGDEVLLDVRDDGRGFAADAPAGSRESGRRASYGLQIMRDRVSDAGGHVAIESEPGHGTTVNARFCLAGAA
jgi:signal transduction histidine kinase